MPTARVRASHSYSSLSRRRLFQLHTSKSSNFLPVNGGHDDAFSAAISPRTFQFNISPLPTKFISKELISLDTFLKKKPTSVIRRMLALDGDAYRASQADVEDVAIESDLDDDATLAELHVPPFVKELEHYEVLAKEANAQQMPSVMLGRKIYDYLPGCSDDEDDGIQESDSSQDDEATSETDSAGAIKTPPPPSPPPCPINFWSLRNEPGFESVKEDDKIVYATALSPPPWHRPTESMLLYEPASPDDEVQCPMSGEFMPHFSW